MPDRSGKLAVFVVPRPRSAWKGAEAIWITISGWAMAAEKLLGTAIVFTSDQSFLPSEILKFSHTPEQSSAGSGRKKISSAVPLFLKILISDVHLFFNTRRTKSPGGKLKHEEVSFVWEQHDLYPGVGRKLATKLKVPFILYVHAPVVWEASKWGVNRHLWGILLERMEAKSLKGADCVAVVSEEVKKKVIQMGVKEEKIFISPMAVNPDFFSVSSKRTLILRDKLGLREKFIVGWTGSFRKFHGLDLVITAFAIFSAKYPEARLLLVGEGALKSQMEELVEKLGISAKVIFFGKVDFSEIPEILSSFDIAVLGAPQGDDFHYSPLKLREYMVSGKAVVAPRVGEIPDFFEPEELKFYEVGNIKSLSSALEFLKENVKEREKIARAGRNAVLRKNTWEKEVEKILQFLNMPI